MGITHKNAFKDRFQSIEQGLKSPAIIDTKKYTNSAKDVLVVPSAPTWGELIAAFDSLSTTQGYHIFGNFLNRRVKQLFEEGQGAALMSAVQIAKETATVDQIGMVTRMISTKAGNWESKTLGTVRKLWAARRHTREIMEKLGVDPKMTKYVLKCAYRLGTRIMGHLSVATKEQGNGSSVKLFFWLISPKRLEAPAT